MNAPGARRHGTQRAPHNEVRIVGGEWRSRRIRFAPTVEIRPTPDRVRETLFNWLGQDLTGLSCLDLFAGSGALGFEAASRGAKRVVLVETDRAACVALRENRDVLHARQVEVVRSDALEFLRADAGKYDVIFLDPPFGAGYAERVLPMLSAHMTAEARLYYESGRAAEWPAGWRVVKAGRAGQVFFQLAQLDTP
ncbi:MAG: 16S rRNA (guanine(966)-N(2))-methyltransferase RsmD, partial [Burkholderiales bacterium]